MSAYFLLNFLGFC